LLTPDSKTTEARRPARSRPRRALGALLLAAAATLAGVMLVPAALGYQRYVIVSDSMTGTYDRGSLVYDKVVPTAGLRVGDVITYQPPRGAGPEGRVTHRIFAMTHDRQGGRVYRTKGDANRAPDPWQFTLSRPKQARVMFHVPFVGYAFAALAIRQVRMLVIGLPALLVALSLLAGLWREAGEDGRRNRAQLADRWDALS
jgi:signal peptidase I